MMSSVQPTEAEIAPAPSDGVHIDFEVAVIGAGFAGLVAGLTLLEQGRTSMVILERGGDVGGVWRDTLYPGCACDIRSNLYSIASKPNPDWRATYATQPEIFAYLRGVAADAGLLPYLRFNTEVTEARFIEGAGCWRLADRAGGVLHVRALILALGPLNRPSTPRIEGIDKFEGTICHSSAWDPNFDLTGKRVAVVGAGASAVQIVPNIASVVAHLTVFQRSAPWVLPRGGRKTTRLERGLFRRLPFAQVLVRSAIYWAMEVVGMAFFGATWLQKLLAAVALRKLAKEVRDPQTRAKLTPDYAVGCKRMTVSDDFYPAFNRANVTLVTEPIVALTPGGVWTRDDQEHAVDHIVFATGFVVADPDDYLRVVGVGGEVLSDLWAQTGAQAHRGVTISGFPNLAMLLGPNSGLSYASAVHVVESQVAYVVQYLDALDAAGPGAAMDVRPEVQEAYNVSLQTKLEGTVWASGCNSWYINRSGRNTAIYPAPTSQYRKLMRRFDAQSYTVTSPSPPRGEGRSGGARAEVDA
ncbi:MAG: flavin-containing monooxygenase [Caulobacteraceae bacterium]